MNLFEAFLTEIGIFTSVSDDEDVKFTTDNSDFVVIDGEEGDYGIIRYSDDGGLLATHTVHGGDSYEIQFTPHGIEIMTPLVKKWLDDRLTEHLQQYYEITSLKMDVIKSEFEGRVVMEDKEMFFIEVEIDKGFNGMGFIRKSEPLTFVFEFAIDGVENDKNSLDYCRSILKEKGINYMEHNQSIEGVEGVLLKIDKKYFNIMDKVGHSI